MSLTVILNNESFEIPDDYASVLASVHTGQRLLINKDDRTVDIVSVEDISIKVNPDSAITEFRFTGRERTDKHSTPTSKALTSRCKVYLPGSTNVVEGANAFYYSSLKFGTTIKINDSNNKVSNRETIIIGWDNTSMLNCNIHFDPA